jgi:hypothetical protein
MEAITKMNTDNILEFFEVWMDDRYNEHVRQFRAGDTSAGIKAIETMAVRIKLAEMLELVIKNDTGTQT